MPPIAEINNKFARLRQELPENWQELSHEQGALTRARKIKGAAELLRAVFSYAVADYSLREVAGLLTGERHPITDEAVRLRLHQCEAWLESMLCATLLGHAPPLALAGRRVKIVDGTVLCCPAAGGTDYRVHLSFAALEQRCCGVKVTNSKGAESFTYFDYEPGDIVLGDRIYGKAKQIMAVQEQGAEVVVRISLQQLRLYNEAGTLIVWKEALRKARDTGKLSLEAFVKDEQGKLTKVYLQGQRLSESEIEKARRRIKTQASKKGHKTRAATLLLCEWITVLTTIAPTELSREVILALYRIRWQIERYIKRLKSILQLGAIRAGAESPLAKVHILAKMLYAVLLEKIAAQRLGVGWTMMTSARRGTWFRVWQMMKDEFIAAIIGSLHWQAWEWRLMLKVLVERKRKRKLQQLPKAVIRWLQENAQATPIITANQPSILPLAA